MSEQLKPNQVALPSREHISAMQVTNLLSIFGAMGNFLIYSANVEEEKGGKLDGGVRMAAESTLVKVCAKLEEVIDEKPRWTAATYNDLESHLANIYKENARMLGAQAAAYEEVISPHYRLKPSLVKMTDGTWIAFCGDPTNLDNALVGAGVSPQNALEAFDALFKGQIPEHLAKWIAEREASIAAGGPPLEFKQQETQQPKNETASVDEERPGNPEKTPRKRNVNRRNRPDNGPDGKLS